MQKKVLVIDDSALMRRVVSDIINKEALLKVEDTAETGRLHWIFFYKGSDMTSYW